MECVAAFDRGHTTRSSPPRPMGGSAKHTGADSSGGEVEKMPTNHILNFLRKSWPERYDTMQFYVRQGLAKLPYLPVPVRLKMSSDEEIEFWWSHVVPFFDGSRGFLDYWGHDVGDLRFLWKALTPGMTFIDIGANQGIYSLVAGKKLGGDGVVIAFEPSPREYQRLRIHLRWNEMSHARAEKLALGATAARTAFFQVVAGDTTRNGLRPPANSDSVTEIPVDLISLDDYASSRGLERVDLIKLDVEGGEVDVLRGATAVVSKFRPIFICEVLDAATRAWGYDACQIIATLQNSGYE